jgi:predicted RND superfamily exporter protein
VATVALAAGIGRLHTEFNVEGSLPANHPFVQIDRQIRHEFGGRNTMIVAIVPREGDVWRTDVLQVVSDVTLEAIRLPDIIQQNVVSLAAPSVRYAQDRGGSISVDYVMREVPKTPEEIAQLRAVVESDPQLRGILVTDDQRAAMVILDFWDTAKDRDIFERVTGLAVPYRDRPLDFYFAGQPVFAMTDEAQSAEMAGRIPFTFLVIAVMLLISFRSIQGMVVPMMTATLSTVWGLGIMGYTGIVLDSWNIAAPILLIAVAAAHSAQMLKRYGEEVLAPARQSGGGDRVDRRHGPRDGGRRPHRRPRLRLAGALRGAVDRELRPLVRVRIASAVVLEMTFIPALRSLLPAPKRVPGEGGMTYRVLSTLHHHIMHARGRNIMVATGVAIAVSALGALFIRTYGSTREYIPHDSLARHHLDEIEKHFPGTITMTILYEGPPGSARTLPVVQHLEALESEIARDPLVLRTSSMADLVKSLHKTFNPEDPNPYRLPDNQELLAQLMFLGESPAFERFTDRGLSKSLLVTYCRRTTRHASGRSCGTCRHGSPPIHRPRA